MVYKRLERVLIQLDAVDSTNSYAANLVKSTKVSSGTVVLTKEQYQGRGQRSNTWTTEAEKNLTFSLIFFCGLSVKHVFYLNVATSLAVRKVLEDVGIKAEIKWPNDILTGTSKISGILVENQLSGETIHSSIIGVGLNVNQVDFGDLKRVTSVRRELGKVVELDDLFDQLYGYLDFYLNLLAERNFDLLKKHYYRYLFQKDVEALYEDADGQFTGIIKGIDERGMLLIDREGESRIYDLKELTYCY